MKTIFNLTIAIEKDDDGSYFAQSKEIDHFAQGTTKDEAIASYFKSLNWTMDEHMKLFGNLDRFKSAEKELV